MAYTATAGANGVALRYVKETVPGTTPATPAMQELQFTSEGFDVQTTSTNSNSIRSDRNIADSVTTEVNAVGTFGFEFNSSGEYEEFLAAVACSTWVGDSLVNGVARASYTFEKQWTDLTNKYQRFTGAQANTFDLAFAVGAMVTGNFGFMVYGGDDASTALDASTTPATQSPIFNLVTDLSAFKIGGSEYTDGLQSFSQSWTNNMRAQRKIGSKYLAGIGLGSFTASGSGQAYFQNATALLDAAHNETFIPIEFTLTKFGNSYTFVYPKCKISNVTRVTSGINTDVECAFNWTAILDSAIGGTVKVTRLHA